MENPKFTSVWDTSFEEMWTWHLKQINIYNKVKWLDWIKNPITLDRFFSFNSTNNSCYIERGSNYLPTFSTSFSFASSKALEASSTSSFSMISTC